MNSQENFSRPLTRGYLENMTIHDLRDWCRIRHYRVHGDRQVLLDRVFNGDPIGIRRYLNGQRHHSDHSDQYDQYDHSDQYDQYDHSDQSNQKCLEMETRSQSSSGYRTLLTLMVIAAAFYLHYLAHLEGDQETHDNQRHVHTYDDVAYSFINVD